MNLLSSVGAFVMTIGFGLLVIDLLVQLRYGRRSRRDPWQATTLEWAMPLPPPPYNFASLPTSSPRATASHRAALAPALARGEGYLGFTRNGWQETLGVHMTSGVPDQVIVLPRATYLPLWTGAGHRHRGAGVSVQGLPAGARRRPRGRGLFVCGAQAPASRATSDRCRSAVA